MPVNYIALISVIDTTNIGIINEGMKRINVELYAKFYVVSAIIFASHFSMMKSEVSPINL